MKVLLDEHKTNPEVIHRFIEEAQRVGNVLKKIDQVYQQIKKNEESPGTEYLFKDIKSRNLEKTIEKLEKMKISLFKFLILLINRNLIWNWYTISIKKFIGLHDHVMFTIRFIIFWA